MKGIGAVNLIELTVERILQLKDGSPGTLRLEAEDIDDLASDNGIFKERLRVTALFRRDGDFGRGVDSPGVSLSMPADAFNDDSTRINLKHGFRAFIRNNGGTRCRAELDIIACQTKKRQLRIADIDG